MTTFGIVQTDFYTYVDSMTICTTLVHHMKYGTEDNQLFEDRDSIIRKSQVSHLQYLQHFFHIIVQRLRRHIAMRNIFLFLFTFFIFIIFFLFSSQRDTSLGLRSFNRCKNLAYNANQMVQVLGYYPKKYCRNAKVV